MPMGLPRSRTIKVPSAPNSPLRAKASSAPPGSMSSSSVTANSAAVTSLIAGAVIPPPQPKARKATFSPLATWSGFSVMGKIIGSTPSGSRAESWSRNFPAASPGSALVAGIDLIVLMAAVVRATASVSGILSAKSRRISDSPSLLEGVMAVAPAREESASRRASSTSATSPVSNSGGASTRVLTRTCGLTVSRLERSIRLPGTLPISVEKRLTLYSGRVVVTVAPKTVPAQETLPPLPTRSVSKATRLVLNDISPQKMLNTKVGVRTNGCPMFTSAF